MKAICEKIILIGKVGRFIHVPCIMILIVQFDATAKPADSNPSPGTSTSPERKYCYCGGGEYPKSPKWYCPDCRRHNQKKFSSIHVFIKIVL